MKSYSDSADTPEEVEAEVEVEVEVEEASTETAASSGKVTWVRDPETGKLVRGTSAD